MPPLAMQITLSGFGPDVTDASAAAGMTTILLKGVQQGGAATALNSVSFNDNGMTPFPDGPAAAPMAGKHPGNPLATKGGHCPASLS
jgi:hypothetical protein